MNEMNELLEHLWELLGDVPINDDEELDEAFMCWPKGTHREDIWRVFDNAHEKGVTYLMYRHLPERKTKARLTRSMLRHSIHFDAGHWGVIDLRTNDFYPQRYPTISFKLLPEDYEARFRATLARGFSAKETALWVTGDDVELFPAGTPGDAALYAGEWSFYPDGYDNFSFYVEKEDFNEQT